MSDNLRRTKADLIYELANYPDDAIIAIFTDYGIVPIDHISYSPPGDHGEDSPGIINLWEDNYASEDWFEEK